MWIFSFVIQINVVKMILIVETMSLEENVMESKSVLIFQLAHVEYFVLCGV